MASPDMPGLYRSMAEIRALEELVLDGLQRGDFSGSTHLCIGQEAIAVGVCAALAPEDPVIATYRGHGWALAKGVPAVELMAEIMGRDSSLNGGRAGSAYLSGPQYGFYGENSIVGAGVPIALGLGIACKREGRQRLPVVVIGDGAMNQGNVHEALNMASVLKVAMLIIVENNGYAEMTPSDALTAVPASERASGYAIASVTVDGNDPEAVRACTLQARAQALASGGPVLIEAMTHRLCGHYSGDVQAYRPAGELDEKRRDDPLVRGEAMAGGAAAAIRAEAAQSMAEAYERARAFPLPQQARSHVYAD